MLSQECIGLTDPEVTANMTRIIIKKTLAEIWAASQFSETSQKKKKVAMLKLMPVSRTVLIKLSRKKSVSSSHKARDLKTEHKDEQSSDHLLRQKGDYILRSIANGDLMLILKRRTIFKRYKVYSVISSLEKLKIEIKIF